MYVYLHTCTDMCLLLYMDGTSEKDLFGTDDCDQMESYRTTS